jgi:hypothetical protein
MSFRFDPGYPLGEKNVYLLIGIRKENARTLLVGYRPIFSKVALMNDFARSSIEDEENFPVRDPIYQIARRRTKVAVFLDAGEYSPMPEYFFRVQIHYIELCLYGLFCTARACGRCRASEKVSQGQRQKAFRRMIPYDVIVRHELRCSRFPVPK